MIVEYIISMLRLMFYAIDRTIYGLIDEVYNLLIQLASTSIFSTELINAFAERIYAFIGIFMLFKVTISLITHVLNPDDFTDKEKGFTSVIKRIILSLVMVVLVPYIFAEAYEFQKLILTENTLVTLIFGTPPDTTGQVEQLAGSTYVDTAGKKMQFTLLSAFIHPNYEEFTSTSSNSGEDLSACKQLYVKDADGNFQFRKRKNGNNSLYHYALNPACFGEYDEQNDIYKSTYNDGSGTKEAPLYKLFVDNQVLYQTYVQGVSQQDYDLTFKQELINYEHNSKYVMSYKWLVSTVVGVVALYMLVLFCIDIAIRSIKLGFLQMIAPIPIISYIDPKSGKDGMFKKWTSMCVKTYLDLFIRLFALFFGIYIISLIGTFKSIHTGEVVDDLIINVFLIIGVLIFVKKLPEILKETFGFDGGTFKDFKWNPIKRFEEDALFGKNILAAGAAGLAGGAAFGTNLLAKKGNVFSALAGGVSATSRGLVGALKGEKFGKNFSNSYGGAMKARVNRGDRHELGIKGPAVEAYKLKQAMGIATDDQIQDSNIKRYDEAISAGNNAKKRAEAEIDKKADKIVTSNGETLGALRDKIEILKSTSIKRSDYGDDEDAYKEAVANLAKATSEANSAYFAARKKATNTYIEKASSGNLTSAFGGGVFDSEDAIVRENVKQMKSAVNKYNLTDSDGNRISVDTSDLGNGIQSLENQKTTIQSSDEYRTAHLIAEQAKKQK